MSAGEKTRVLVVPDWLEWITGTIALAHMRWNPDYEIDVVPMGVVEMAVKEGWRPWEDFDVVHLLTTQAVQRVGHHFLGRVPTATTLHHVHDEADVPFDVSGDAIMVSGSQWERWLLERGTDPGKIVRVPYGVDAGKFHPPSSSERERVRRKWELANDETVIGFAGKKGSDNFGRKGFDIYCGAIAALAAKGVPVVAFVLGSGWQDDMDKFLPHEVRRIHVPYIADQTKIYHAIDFYWVASRIEGGPVPLLEAMASGVVSVCSKVGMVEDVVADGVDSLIAESGTPKDFAEATANLLRNPLLRTRMASAAREKILTQFDWPKSGPTAKVLYRTAIRNFTTADGRQPASSDSSAGSSTPDARATRAAMWSVPDRIRDKALVGEGLNMVRELLRVRNSRAASKAALRLIVQYPRQWSAPVAVLFSSWKGRSTVMLGRWKQKLRGKW